MFVNGDDSDADVFIYNHRHHDVFDLLIHSSSKSPVAFGLKLLGANKNPTTWIIVRHKYIYSKT